MPKNYYVILGIPANSALTDIKEAYRRLAKEYHPDYYGKDQAPFQLIQEAYSVLSNKQSRKLYDNTLQRPFRQAQSINVESMHKYTKNNIEPLIPEKESGLNHYSSFDQPHHRCWAPLESLFDQFLYYFTEHRRKSQ